MKTGLNSYIQSLDREDKLKVKHNIGERVFKFGGGTRLELKGEYNLPAVITECQFVLKILSGNEILTSIKGHNSVTNLRKMTANNPNLDIVNINSYKNLVKYVHLFSRY